MTNTCSARRTHSAARPAAVPTPPNYLAYEPGSLAVDRRRASGTSTGNDAALVSPVERRVRLTRPSRGVILRRRALLAAAAVAMLVMLALPWGGTGGRSLATPGAAPVGPLTAGTTYVVRRGDTLWGIAERLAPGSDPRPLVAKLESQIGGDTVQPGESLRLP